MTRKLIDPVVIGSKGGKNSRVNLTEDEAAALGRDAANARWEQFYRNHPEKLKERKAREARRTGKVGRPRKKKAGK